MHFDILVFVAPEASPPVFPAGFHGGMLAAGHVTTAPPQPIPDLQYLLDMESVIRWHRTSILALQEQDNVHIVSTREDLPKLGKVSIIPGLQCPPMDCDVEQLFNEGIRVCTIAYEKRNQYGSGFAVSDGLSVEGMSFLRQCAHHGILVDLSHANHDTARGAIKFQNASSVENKKPLLATHVGCYEVYPHGRNLPDDILRSIVEAGGIVGITNLTFILSKEYCGLDAFFSHLNHALNVCGEEHVAIGTDGPYCVQEIPEYRKQFEMMNKMLNTTGGFEPYFPHQPWELNTPVRMQILDAEMERRGFNTGLRERILGKNALRYFQNNLPAA